MTQAIFGEKRGGAPSWSLESPAAADATIAHQTPLSSAVQRKYLRESRPSAATDGSLTSLGWLQNLKGPDLFSPEVRVMLHPPSPCSEDGCSSWETVSSSSVYSPAAGKNDPLLSAGGDAPSCSSSPLRQCLIHSTEFRSAPKRYRSDSTKPPFPHTSLVYLALQHSRSGKASFHEICRWIKSNFKFFKEAEPGWQDSIKESLLRNELFVKVARTNGESSKGTCWAIHPQLMDLLEKETNSQIQREGRGGRRLKRAFSYSGKDSRQPRSGGGGRKRIKSEAQAPVDPCGLPGDLDWVSLLSSQRVSCGSYGSPILGPPDLGQVGDPMICSPLIIPTSMTATSPPSTPAEANPALDCDLKNNKDVEEVFRNHNSRLPSPHLLPWEDSRPESPFRHPWAESRETTLNSLGRQQHTVVLPPFNHTSNSLWSPDTTCYSTSASCSTSTTNLSHRCKPHSAESYIY